MNTFALIIVIVAAVSAEPVRPLNSRVSSAPQQQAPPYPAAGWKPSGQQFRLPERQEQVPQTVYGPPPKYGPPTTTEPASETVTTDVPTADNTTASNSTTKNSTASIKEEPKSENLQEERGVYYVYHPNGFLQKVIFATSNDLQNMAYTAKIQYENVEPIRDPIYTYDPETLTFRQVQI